MRNSVHIVTNKVSFLKGAILVVTLTSWFVSILLGQRASDTEIEIRALEKQWTYAQSHNDNRALNLIFDNALVYVEYGRLVSKGEYLARIRQEVPSTDEIVMDPVTVHTFQSTAIVIGSYREKQFQRGQHEIRRWRFVDTWVYKKNGWVLVAAAATEIQ